MPARPLTAIALAFIVGVALGLERPVPALGLIGLGGFFLVRFLKPAGWLLTAFCLLGWGRGFADSFLHPDTLLSHAPRRSAEVVGTVISEPETTEWGCRFVLKARAYREARRWIPVSGKTAVRHLATGPDYGDTLWLYGHLELPRDRRNPGGFDELSYLARQRVHTLFRVRFPGDCRFLGDEAAPFPMRWALFLKRRMTAAIQRLFPPLEAAVLTGLLLGARAGLPVHLKEAFVGTGTVHVLATAGLHVGLIAFLLERLLWHLTLPPKLRAALMILTLSVYALMAGGRPSVVRAASMASLYLTALFFDREPDAPNSLATAAAVLLAVHPLALRDGGFQLSFACVSSLFLITPHLEHCLRPLERRLDLGRSHPEPALRLFSARVARNLTACLAVSTAAQVGVLPLVAFYDNMISPVSVLANLLIVPPMALILGMGLLTALSGALGLPFAILLAALTEPLVTCLIGAVLLCSRLPLAWIALVSPPAWAIMLYYGLLAAAWALIGSLRQGVGGRV
ncbi:MAG: ComEC family competence protein [Armatimonadetes bacterium]|nr:ComEC family competence protein [Armatimonadota bacterium]